MLYDIPQIIRFLSNLKYIVEYSDEGGMDRWCVRVSSNGTVSEQTLTHRQLIAFYRQQRMRQQNAQVNGTEPLWVLKAGVTRMRMVGEIADEKKSRADQRSNHAVSMRVLPPALDKNVPARQQNGACCVKARINGGEVRDAHWFSLSKLSMSARIFS